MSDSNINQKGVAMLEIRLNNVYTENVEAGNRMITKILKWGNSHGITLSKEIMEQCGLSANDKVRITVEDRKIVVEKESEAITFESIFKDWKGGQYEGGEFSWGEEDPVGKEIW